MRAKRNIGFVLLLAALLLLSASGVCAAVMERPLQPSHPCCPQTPSTAASLSCCQPAGGPAATPTLPASIESDDAVPVVSVDALPAVSHAPVEAISTATHRAHSPLLYIRLHQFLI